MHNNNNAEFCFDKPYIEFLFTVPFLFTAGMYIVCNSLEAVHVYIYMYIYM